MPGIATGETQRNQTRIYTTLPILWHANCGMDALQARHTTNADTPYCHESDANAENSKPHCAWRVASVLTARLMS
jgi:hypothetical protein